jgi:hypothetical protein
MNRKTLSVRAGLLLVPALFLTTPARAAVTFANTPAAISNTYTGTITFQIGGLTSGDTVLVRKYLDLNANGAVDATDPLVQQFQLTDGQGPPVFGGVTNNNVPGDLNPAAGAITAQMNFQNGDFSQIYVAKYLYVLSSPAGHFSPITNSFNVTNFPFGQTISGNVVSNNTGTTLPDSIVILFPPPSPGNDGGPGNPVAGVVANNAGTYSIQVPPGAYVPLAFRSNYVGNYTASPMITLGSGQNTNLNLSLTNATASISGRVVDAATNSIGLAGTFLPVTVKGTNITNELITGGYTDTNGNFSIGVTAGQWKISNARSLIVNGYVELNNGTDVTAGATGVTIAIPKATAIFYGTVKDSLGNPLFNVAVGASDNNAYFTDGYTDTNGNYVAGAVGGLSNDYWHPEIDNNPTNYVFSQSPYNQNPTNLSAGQAVRQNFTAIAASSLITGKVTDSSNNPIVGVGVNAYASISGVQYNPSTAHTDANGHYSMSVADGNWSVSLNCGCSDCSDGLNPSYQCPNSQNTNLSHDIGVVNFIVQPANENQLFGYVRDNLSNPIAGVTVYANGNSSLSTTTDDNGYYTFSVPSGDWDVSVDCTGLSDLGYSCVGDQDVNVSGNSLEVDFTAQTSSSPLQITTTTLSNATQNAFYTTTLAASGGVPPYTWALVEGSASLPLGMTLTANGVISGTTSGSGTFPFIVTVTDTTASVTFQILSLTVNPSSIPPVIVLTAPAHSGSNQFQFTFNSASGVSYVIQDSVDLRSWTSVLSFDGSGGPVTIIDPNAPGTGARFYRVKIGP